MSDQQPKSGRTRKERRAEARAGKGQSAKSKDRDSSIGADLRKTIETPISLEKALEAVAQLSHADAGPDHYEDFQREADMERADRGAAILLASNVENTLERAIVRLLNPPNAGKQLFGYQAPMGSFSAKITMGHAIGIYGPETRRNLDVIRAIRNAFAHAKRPIRFADDEMIALVCFLIVHEKRTFSAETTPHKSRKSSGIIHPARIRFRDVCDITSRNLLFQNFMGPISIASDALKPNLAYAGYEIWAREPPLP